MKPAASWKSTAAASGRSRPGSTTWTGGPTSSSATARSAPSATLWRGQDCSRWPAAACWKWGVAPATGWKTLERFGARREALAGIDLDPGRAAACAARFPGADIRAGDASHLPWESGSFDVVFQSTVFSSILDPAMRRDVAGEMLRVLAPGGAIFWYDFFMDNPANPNVKGVRRREIATLFPGCRVDLRRATLAPPLARRVVPVSWTLAAVLESLRVFDTHYLGTVSASGRNG